RRQTAARDVGPCAFLHPYQQPRGRIMSEQLLETKSLTASESFENFARTFQEFKSANDQRLDTIEKGESVDVLTTEKLQRLDQALDVHKQAMERLELKQARPALEGGVNHMVSLEHKNAFDRYVRRGEVGGLRGIEGKAMSIGSAP